MQHFPHQRNYYKHIYILFINRGPISTSFFVIFGAYLANFEKMVKEIPFYKIFKKILVLIAAPSIYRDLYIYKKFCWFYPPEWMYLIVPYRRQYLQRQC